MKEQFNNLKYASNSKTHACWFNSNRKKWFQKLAYKRVCVNNSFPKNERKNVRCKCSHSVYNLTQLLISTF